MEESLPLFDLGLSIGASRRHRRLLGEQSIESGLVTIDQIPRVAVSGLLRLSESMLLVPGLQTHHAIDAQGPLKDEHKTIQLIPVIPSPRNSGNRAPLSQEIVAVFVNPCLCLGFSRYVSHCTSSGIATADIAENW